MNIPIHHWSGAAREPAVEDFLRRPAFDPAAEAAAADILADVRARGEAAVIDAAARVDHVRLAPGELRVTGAELEAASAAVPERFKLAISSAHERVSAFARAGMRPDWEVATPRGGRVGERFLPLDRVGVYIPGGTAPLASTAIMTATLAKVAGVGEIVACTPCAPDKSVNPMLLHALRVAGATEVYRVGGAQAIGLMAYGAGPVRPVRKIVGPGGAFVTAAKRLVYGAVGLDLVAGPSEICVVADGKSEPSWVAADLLSQIEHGTGLEKALLVTDDEALAAAVAAEVARQLATLPRAGRMAPAIEAGGLMLAVVPDLDEAARLADAFAPEHLELLVDDARAFSGKIRSAGAIFIGRWTTESAGDFAAGPSHVLPTGGAAAGFSGLTVEDFRRRTSLVEYTRDDLADALPVIGAFAEIEGLAAHARSATIRME